MNAAQPSNVGAKRTSGRPATAAPSLPGALEQLFSGSLGMITKRIDLAQLEAEEMLTRFLGRAALAGLGVLLTAGAWFTTAGAVVVAASPASSTTFPLGAFAILNTLAALGVLAVVVRQGRPAWPDEPSTRGTHPPMSDEVGRGA